MTTPATVREMREELPLFFGYYTDDTPPSVCLDFRTSEFAMGTKPPYIDKNSRAFDDVAHAMVHDYRWKGVPIPDGWLDMCEPWLPKAEYKALRKQIRDERDAKAGREYQARVDANQPDTTGAEL